MPLAPNHAAAWIRRGCRAVAAMLMALTATAAVADSGGGAGTAAHPLRVMLIPADGGTASGTRADFAPLFNAVSRSTGLHFDLRVGQSYSAVIEAMKSGLIDIAWFGPVSYVQARAAGAAELLAVSVVHGESVYYAGIFVPSDAPIRTVADLKGKRVAFGDINSSSSFAYQVAMMLDAGLDPSRDLASIRMTGSHAASLSALAEGMVDAACLSFESYMRAVNRGAIDPQRFRVLARSAPIPNPPMALHPALAPDLKATLRTAFARVNEDPTITPDMIRGYGGKRVDRYDAAFPESAFDQPAQTLARIGDELRAAILRKAAAP